jgi:hypothetical protein
MFGPARGPWSEGPDEWKGSRLSMRRVARMCDWEAASL